jgi:CRP-like cAMP-binding protein
MNTYTFKAGEIIYFSAQKGPVYRVLNGSVRLDRQFNDIEPTFANLAVAHDLIGVEVLVEGSYSFEARALTDCQIEVWSEPAFLWVESFAKELLQSFKRKADVVTLRCGTAKQRVLNLIHLLEQDGEDLRLPRLRDISEITDLTIETISRTMTQLKNQGVITQVTGSRGKLRSCYRYGRKEQATS